jgi:glycosyltransferase involved in cell wall biosynthesis
VRILHVIHRYPPAIGGSETWCAGLARWQARQGHEVTVVTHRVVEEDELWSRPTPPSAVAVGPDDVDQGVRVRRCAVEAPRPAVARALGRAGLGAWTGAASSELAGTALRLARRSDVVHAHTVPLVHGHLAWAAARAARRPFVLTPHFHVGDAGHEHTAVRWLLRHADRVVVMTPSEADALAARGVRTDRIVQATNAVEPAAIAPGARGRTRAALGIADDVPLVVFLGRKAETKGLDVLFHALPRLAHRPPPVLALAGPSTAWYRAQPRADGPVRVVDLPAIPAAAKDALLAAADLLVLPSRHEAFGIVFLEAWTAGVAVVGADIPAVRDAVGGAGDFFRPDDPADLARAIDAALADPAARARAVACGRERVHTQHTWDRVGRLVDDAYTTLGATAIRVAPDPRT